MFSNGTSREIALDDVHAILYERFVAPSYQLDLSHIGEVKLLKDNCILKDQRSYSLHPGDGFKIDLALRMTNKSDDAARVIFGLLVDYLVDYAGASPTRQVCTSDSVYVVRYKNLASPDLTEFIAVDREWLGEARSGRAAERGMIGYLDQLGGILQRHLSFQGIPKA